MERLQEYLMFSQTNCENQTLFLNQQMEEMTSSELSRSVLWLVI